MSIRSWFRLPLRPKSFGEEGEQAAARYLRRQGYRIVTTRLRQRYGEVDIIALDDRTIVFVEVKSRRRFDGSQPAEAVDIKRQQRLSRAALAFLKSHGLLENASRFDVLEVCWPREADQPTIRHIQDAFPVAGKWQFYN